MAGSVRHRDPQPVGRPMEVAFVVLAGILLVVAGAALTGLSLSARILGEGWVWPESRNEAVEIVIGLMSGHPAQGLPSVSAERVPGPFAVYGSIVLVELLALGAAVALGLLVVRYRRPGDARRGMATRSEAAHVLGARRLRAAGPVVRPDVAGGRRGWRFWTPGRRAEDREVHGPVGEDVASEDEGRWDW
jgi:hypothetical protein